jgi:dienelactone hydrolase
MKKPIWIFLNIALMMFSFSSAQKEESGAKKELIIISKEFVILLVQGDFSAAVKNFDATMAKVSPPEKLKEVWELVTGQVGQFKRLVGSRTESLPRYDIVFITCEFEKATLDVKVVFNKKRQIAGQFFVPSNPPEKYSPPSYVNLDSFQEKDIEVGSGEWKVPGTLTLPKGNGPFPSVVLVHGSGPQDRDETIGPNKPFRDLAWGLASQGIAALRYEKRTKTHGAKIIASEELRWTVKEETVDDTLAAVELMRKSEKIDSRNIFVLGHSLGGMLVPRIGLRDPNITGFIIMAGLTRPLEDVTLEQINYIFTLDKKISEDERTHLNEVELAVQKIKKLKPSDTETHRERILGAYPEYWLDLRGYHPAEAAKQIKQPMLILQGGRDYQVTEEDFEAWKSALSSHHNVDFQYYPELNHLFIPGKGKITPAEYQKTGHVAKTVLEDIRLWIQNLSQMK